ncbi:MAG: CHASE domain-containing protein [Verrucomicrobia bacterium]|nr:CHASE domain-containing protein [Verrucomicrobiota bacterium]
MSQDPPSNSPFDRSAAQSVVLRERAAVLVVVIGGILSVLAFLAVRGQEREKSEADFARRAQNFTSIASDRLQRHQESLYTLRSLFHYSGEVTREEFGGAARDIISRQVGVQALEWIVRLPGPDRERFESAVRAEGFPGFQLTERVSGNTLRPAAARPEYFPVLYIEPYAGNEPALGFDLVSGVTWSQLQEIAGTGLLASSGRLPLLDRRGGSSWGYIMELPVYHVPLAADTPDARRAALRGFVFGIFRISDVLESFFKSGDAQGLEVLFLDRSATEDRQFLHYSSTSPRADHTAPPPTAGQMAAGLHLRVPLDHGGRKWELWFRPTPEWQAQQSGFRGWLTLALGLALTGTAGAWFFGAQRRSAHVERQVARRTAELSAVQEALQEDIQRREEIERQLRESEARLQAILDNSPACIFVKDPAGYYVLANRPFELLVGRDQSGIIGQRDSDLFPTTQAAIFGSNDRLVLDAGIPMEFEESSPGPDGPRTHIVQKFPLRATNGQIYALCGIATEITARKRAEAELQESRRQLGNLLGQLPGAAFRCGFDDNLTLLFGTEGLLPLTGYPPADFLGGRVHLAHLTVDEDRASTRRAVGEAMQARRSFEVEYRIRHRDGRVKWALVRGRPVFADDGSLRFIEGLAIDVTALKSAEAEKLAFERQLLQTQKLESLGVLAGGIAHDFNNLLTAMLGNATLARLAVAADSPATSHLDQIEAAARRAADLCQQMLAYAGKRTLVTRATSLTELVRSTATLLSVSIHKNTRLTLTLPDGLPAVMADASQLQQIVMNLVINAADAIGEKPGEIAVTTFVREASTELLRAALHRPDLPAGRYVGLEVSDNGSGMTPETMARIFEPFFTTKFSGRGLGLAAVLGIVQSHQGALYVESVVGRGSTFRLLLPASDATPAPSPTSTPLVPVAAAPAAKAEQPRGTVLIVDDEEAVRIIASAALRRQNLHVIAVADGEEALRRYQEQPDAIVAVLLDLTMPGISGEETLRRLRVLNPHVRVIVMSGYSEEDTMRRCAALGASEFMAKPFELSDLLGKFPRTG